MQGVQRALAFQGPSVITGDFNRDLSDCAFWKLLQLHGFHDCAILARDMYGHEPEPTYKNLSRRSFIIISSELIPYFQMCQTVEHEAFPQHPVLEARFSIGGTPLTRRIWNLPKSMDDIMFDPEQLQTCANEVCETRQTKFDTAIREYHADEAFRQLALAFDETYEQSAVTTDGVRVGVPRKCLKRCRKKLTTTCEVSAPILKPARQGEVNFPMGQISLSLRRWVKQARRLQNLHRQLLAHEAKPRTESGSKCDQLWWCIYHCNGFPRGFALWIMQQFGVFVPQTLPPARYVQSLFEEFHGLVLKEIKHEQYLHWKKYHQLTLDDLSKGGKMAYRSVREPQPPPLSFVTHVIQQPIQRTRWPKEGLQRVKFLGDCKLQVGQQVTFQQQIATLTGIEDNFLVVDRRLKLYSTNDMMMNQRQHTSIPSEMNKLVGQAWDEFWLADEVDCDEFPGFVTCLADCPSCPFKEFSAEGWGAMMTGVNLNSARGACGFSMKDCKTLPGMLLEWVFTLFAAIESGMRWPERCTMARVVMLAKPGENQHEPLSVRPITILSTVYRLWSRYRSLQVLEFLGSQLPPQIGGIAVGVSSDCLMAYAMDIIDDALVSNQQRCGLILDLQKCFNLIPRKILGQLMKHAGLDQKYIDAHQMMLKHLQRLLELNGQVGDAHASTCGVPEGCAFSVVSMVVLTALAADTILTAVPQAIITMFADNWGFITETVEQLQQAIDLVQQLVKSRGMKIAPGKSWTWGTTTAVRRQLKNLRIGDKAVEVKLTAKDLGCDVSYSYKKCCKTIRKRAKKAVQALHRIRRKKLPKKFKHRMANVLSVGMVGYGSELQHLSSDVCHQIRSGIAAVNGHYKSGASVWLANNTTGLVIDPQLRLIRRKIKFFRRYFYHFPQQKQGFLDRISWDWTHRRGGLAKQFVSTFQEIGWTCSQNGVMTHESGLVINWTTDSLKYIFHCLHKAWTKFVAKQVTRPNWDVECFSPTAFSKSLKHRDLRQSGILQALASGKHVTDDGLRHFARISGEGNCVHCGYKDTKAHRVYECPHFNDVRKRYKQELRWLQSQPVACMAFGIVPDDDEAMKLKLNLRQQLELHIPMSDCDEAQTVFTDGACFFGDMWDCALAGAAVILVNETEQTAQEAARFLLPSHDHSAFRAESFAVLRALELYHSVDIHTDCQAVVNNVQEILLAKHENRTCKPCEHADIWELIGAHIAARETGCVRVFKTKAHVDWKALPEGPEKFRAYCNDFADRSAKKAVICDHYDLWQRMQHVVQKRETIEKHMIRIHDMLAEIHLGYYDDQERANPTESMVPPNLVSVPQQPHFCMTRPTDAQICEAKFGEKFLSIFVDWVSSLQWGVSDHCSCLELYFGFALATEVLVPVLVPGHGYVLRQDSMLADVAPLDLRTQSGVWIKVIKWWLKAIGDPFQVTRDLGLSKFGYSIPVAGMHVRPKMHHAPQVAEALWSYFHVRGQARTYRDFNRPWTHKHVQHMT